MIDKIESDRYSGIISAIEFFSQRFELDQIIYYIYSFSKDLLLPDNIALWNLKDNNYIIFNKMGYKDNFSFEYNEKYNEIVYFHAGLLYEKQIKSLLPQKIHTNFDPDFCIPLIMDKSLFGIIAVNRSKNNSFTHDDEVIAVALMNLFSISLTNYSAFKNLETIKVKLDEKIFNLFAINHSSRALLSELSLSNLCNLAISIFSELTQSSFTTFFIKDPLSENYKLMSYKNIKDHKMQLDLTLFHEKDKILMLPVLIDMKNKESRDLFICNFFNGQEIIEKINPEYIVLLKKNTQLVGFVTLGTKINDTLYDNSVFELVESLASSTYIAINNAFYIEKIEEQKKLINNKLNEMVRLNNLMKNINTAQTYEQVISLVMNTLNISYNIDMGFFSLFDSEKQVFNITDKLNIKDSLMQIKMSPSLYPLLEGEPILVYEEDKIFEIFPDITSDTFIKPAAGLIVIPVFISIIDIKLIGFFALLNNRSKSLITEENLLVFEAISTHIAPVIYQLQYAEKIKNTYSPDYSYVFLEDLKHQLNEAIEFSLDLYIIHIFHMKAVHFYPNAVSIKLVNSIKNTYNIDSRNTFIFTNNSLDIENIKSILKRENEYEYEIYSLHKDFTDFQSFIEIFEA